MDRVLGVVDVLSDAEQAQLMGCEAVVEMGWRTFVEVGLALAQIRDSRLYRVEFETFDAYCRAKWQYTRIYVHQLISAAQLFTHLSAICKHPKPDHESQVRPLIGLSLPQAQAAWESAAEKAGNRRITARMVQNAVKELQFTGETKPETAEPAPAKAQCRQLIEDILGQLLVLVRQKASYDLRRKSRGGRTRPGKAGRKERPMALHRDGRESAATTGPLPSQRWEPLRKPPACDQVSARLAGLGQTFVRTEGRRTGAADYVSRKGCIPGRCRWVSLGV